MHFSKELYYYIETRAKDVRSSDFSREARNPDSYRKLQCFNVTNIKCLMLKKKKTSFLKHCVGKNRHTGNTQTCTRAHTHIFGLDLVYRLSAWEYHLMPSVTTEARLLVLCPNFVLQPMRTGKEKHNAISPMRKHPRDCHVKAISGSRIQKECLVKGSKQFHQAKGKRYVCFWSIWNNRDQIYPPTWNT